MTQRRWPVQPASDDIFGAWVPIIALTASKTRGLDAAKRDVIIARIERAYADLASADAPKIGSWRDLADAMNFLQSLGELEWSQDPGGVVDDTKAALEEAARNYNERHKLRLTGPRLAALRTCVDQFTELLGQLSAHSFWVAVAHAKRRVQKILRGGKARGDIVVTL